MPKTPTTDTAAAKPAKATRKTAKPADDEISRMVKVAVNALEDIKGKDITVIDVAHLTSMFDRMIIVTGDSNRQVKSLADNVQEKLKAAGAEIIGMEGADVGEWVLVDAGSLVIHCMQPVIRGHYNLEELWGAAQSVRQAAGTRE
jgi:ribosome-associated protein